MNTASILQRTLQALLITGISIFALAPAIAGDKPKLILHWTKAWSTTTRIMPMQTPKPLSGT
ncbi:MAG: hypothetical protein ACYTGA_14005 [Planctomycetota bacterium]